MYLSKALAATTTLTLATLAGAQRTAVQPTSLGKMQSVSSLSSEARTPISSLPFTIDESGSYYLTRHLEAPNGAQGITVDAPYVTIDLNGFTLAGFDGVGNGVSAVGGGSRLTVKNGNIVGWDGWAVHVASGNADVQVIQDVTVGSCDSGGLWLQDQARVASCTISSTGGVGIRVEKNASVTDCLLRTIAGSGIETGRNARITGTTLEAIGGIGIDADENSVLRDCIVDGSGDVGYRLYPRMIAQGCVSIGATGDGFASPLGATGVVLETCVASTATADGIRLRTGSVATGCASTDNGARGFHLDGATASSCSADGNATDGFDLDDSVAAQSTARSNGQHGFLLRDYSVVSQSQVSGNSDYNLFARGEFNLLSHMAGHNNISAQGWTFSAGVGETASSADSTLYIVDSAGLARHYSQ